jgi:type II secretory pathway pseudopilin PulG
MTLPIARCRRGTGTTLVETLLVVSILLSILGIALALWQTGRSRGERIDFQLEAARAMAQLLVLLEDDLVHLLPGPRLATRPRTDPVRLVTLARVPARAAPGPGGLPLGPDLRPQAERVTWVFDPSLGRLIRNGTSLTAGPFADVRFTYRPASTGWGDTLTIEITAVPPGADWRLVRTPRITRTFTRHCQVATVHHLAEEWAGP